jgi:aryl-alcohol dehydrogenase-like predicted oxidoreductase
MEHRRLGTSDLEVSLVGLGCNNFGMKIDLESSRKVIDAALDAGIDFFDTADLYGSGKSEEFIGEVLGQRRSRVRIGTKFGAMRMTAGQKGWGTRAYVLECAEASLARLRTDYIDLYQMHYPDPGTPIEETLGALDDLVRQGKVRQIGHSNFTGEMIAAADAAAARSGRARFVSAQNEWSLLRREVEADVIPACEKNRLGMLPYFPLASGMLTGKYRRGEKFAPGTRLATMGDYFAKIASDENFAKVEALGGVARAHGHSLLELAMGWLAAQPSVASVIAGATTPEQVRANAASMTWKLKPAELAEIDRALASAS